MQDASASRPTINLPSAISYKALIGGDRAVDAYDPLALSLSADFAMLPPSLCVDCVVSESLNDCMILNCRDVPVLLCNDADGLESIASTGISMRAPRVQGSIFLALTP